MNDKPKDVPANAPEFSKQIIAAELLDEAARDAGKGVSTDPADRIIPLLYILQSGSPAVAKRGNAHIPDAEAGDFWLRNAASNPIRSGITGINVLNCGMVRRWVEWRPNRQGYVTEHDQPPADTEDVITRDEAGNEKVIQVRRSNKHVIEDTRKIFLLIDGMPYVFPCKGTLHTFARSWQTHLVQLLHPTTGKLLPSFYHRYRLTTAPVDNAKGKWFSVKFDDLGPGESRAEYAAGKRLNDMVERGVARTETPTVNGE
jgi:hypothetical protein